MTYCFRCIECGKTFEYPDREHFVCPSCGSDLARDYRAENGYVSVKARPTSRKRHWGKYVSR